MRVLSTMVFLITSTSAQAQVSPSDPNVTYVKAKIAEARTAFEQFYPNDNIAQRRGVAVCLLPGSNEPKAALTVDSQFANFELLLVRSPFGAPASYFQTKLIGTDAHGAASDTRFFNLTDGSPRDWIRVTRMNGRAFSRFESTEWKNKIFTFPATIALSGPASQTMMCYHYRHTFK